jgi:hypothetical protein
LGWHTRANPNDRPRLWGELLKSSAKLNALFSTVRRRKRREDASRSKDFVRNGSVSFMRFCEPFGVRTRPHVVFCWLVYRAVARNISIANDKGPPPPRHGAAVFALHPVASEDWRRGELNPCPLRYPLRHLHVYPVVSFKEPNVAPAHCRLPSVHEIDSRTGAVAPPVRQPAVHVCRRSRRPTSNVAVN